jgi:hypothetical protein
MAQSAVTPDPATVDQSDGGHTCPEWCVGHHDEGRDGVYHYGATVTVNDIDEQPRGVVPNVVTGASHPVNRWVAVGDDSYTPAGARELASAITAVAEVVEQAEGQDRTTATCPRWCTKPAGHGSEHAGGEVIVSATGDVPVHVDVTGAVFPVVRASLVDAEDNDEPGVPQLLLFAGSEDARAAEVYLRLPEARTLSVALARLVATARSA